MKKILVILFLAIVSINAFADDNALANAASTVHSDIVSVVDSTYHDVKSIVNTAYNDGKEFAKDIYPDVKSAVVSIAKGIGVAAEHVYTVLVKQFVVKGVGQGLLFISGIIILIIGIVLLSKYIKRNTIITWKVIFPIVICTIGFFMIVSVNYNEMLTGLINPEYSAIDYILDYSKTISKNI